MALLAAYLARGELTQRGVDRVLKAAPDLLDPGGSFPAPGWRCNLTLRRVTRPA